MRDRSKYDRHHEYDLPSGIPGYQINEVQPVFTKNLYPLPRTCKAHPGCVGCRYDSGYDCTWPTKAH